MGDAISDDDDQDLAAAIALSLGNSGPCIECESNAGDAQTRRERNLANFEEFQRKQQAASTSSSRDQEHGGLQPSRQRTEPPPTHQRSSPDLEAGEGASPPPISTSISLPTERVGSLGSRWSRHIEALDLSAWLPRVVSRVVSHEPAGSPPGPTFYCQICLCHGPDDGNWRAVVAFASCSRARFSARRS